MRINNKKKIKTLILGLGRISSSLEKDKLRNHPCTHSGVLFSQFGRKFFSVQGIYDLQTTKIQQYCDDWNLQNNKISKTLNEIKLQNFDLAVIASSAESHLENFQFCSELKIPNVILEKPICDKLQHAIVLKTIADKNNINVWLNHERRYHPVYIHIKNIVSQSLFGKLITIKGSVLTSKLNPGKAFSNYTGPIIHDGTHLIDLIYWYAGTPNKITSKVLKPNNSKIEDQCIAIMEHQNSVTSFIEIGGMRKYFQFEIDLEFENGRCKVGNDSSEFFIAKKSNKYSGFNSLMKIPNLKISDKFKNPFVNLYKEVYDVIYNRKTSITTNLKDGIEIMYILDKLKNKSKVEFY